MRVVRIAASSLVIADSDLLSRECWILPDGEEVVSSTCLRLVAVAREAALRVIDLRSVNRATAEANTIILEASITKAIAYARVLAQDHITARKQSSSLQTFAVGNTLLNSHIVRRQR